ncbi:MAG TPA: arylesterase [Patescibacteria group bacterium]|nr:arylesterase [Patescibacteria group bacterium]
MAMTALFAGAASADAAPKTILAFGDSLTAGYGLARSESFASQLEARLKKEGLPITVINGGVSGDTTAGGLRRLDYALRKNPDVVILELGANDMLRATHPDVTRANLEKMLDTLKARKIPVLLAGMRAFSNLPQLDAAYVAMYRDLARKYDAILYPFFLEGVAGNAALNLEDGVHPTADGIAVIVEKILPSVAQLLTKTKSE